MQPDGPLVTKTGIRRGVAQREAAHRRPVTPQTLTIPSEFPAFKERLPTIRMLEVRRATRLTELYN